MALGALRSALLTSALVMGVALGTSACASDSDPGDAAASPGSPAATASASTSASATALPGEPVDIGPGVGDVVAVVGISYDDVLTVSAAPGPDQDIVATLDPLADDVLALGDSRLLADSIWYRVSVNGTSGWVNGSFVQYLGQVDDVTSSVIAEVGSTPREATMPELGLVVAEQLASTDPPSQITMTTEASVGDLGEVTYDVVGLGDDSIGGLRLHVFGTPDGSSFVLKSVEQTSLCQRGVADGLCL